jgi:DNA-binding LacI/PurR family transcriptional regulator
VAQSAVNSVDTVSLKKTPTLKTGQAAKPPANGKRLQMVDVARLAGVSLATVSRALNGSPTVNEVTRQRITELAKSLNYTINVSAQTLRAGVHNTVAVIIPFFTGKRQHITDPFFLAMLGSLGDALTELGYDMLLSRIDSTELESAADLVRSGRSKGLIIIGQFGHHQKLNQLAMQGVPLVVWGAQLPQQFYVSVGGDNMAGGFLATDHLLGIGSRRIVFMGDTALPEVELRYRGYLQAHEKYGVEPEPEFLLKTPFLADMAREHMQTLCQSRRDFDAVFAASDLLAMSCANVFRDLGLRIPQDVRVMGYDDVEAAAHFYPPISTVRQPIEQAGMTMVDLLMKQIAGQVVMPQVLPTTLLLRAST